MFSPLSSSSMLLVLLLLNALIIFGVPAGDRGNESKTQSNESSEAVISKELNHAISYQSLMADALTTDYSKIGRNVGNDVELFGEGLIPVILRDKKLAFQVCDSCSGTSYVCYKSGDIGAIAAKYCSGLTSYCGFEAAKGVIGAKQTLFVNGNSVEGQCQSFAMRYSNVTLANGYFYPSCKPIIGENQMVLLEVFAKQSCPITIPNAYIPDPPTTTVSPARSHEASDSTAAVQSANFFETTVGIVVIVICVIVVILAIIGVILCLLCKETKIFQSKPKEVNVESIQIDQPEYTAVEDIKKSKTEAPKKKQQNVNMEKKSMVEKKKKHAEAPKKTEANAPKKDIHAKEMVKKAAEEPAKIADEPKMKSDPTQEPTKTEDGPPPPATDESAGAEDDTPPLPPPAVVVEKAASMPKNRAENAPPAKRHHAKRAPPTFEVPESVKEMPPRPQPSRKKKNMSPTLDSQDRERRTMIRNGQAVPRPGENIRKYLPKNY